MMKETSIRAKLFGANNNLYVIVLLFVGNFMEVVTDSDLRYIDRRAISYETGQNFLHQIS